MNVDDDLDIRNISLGLIDADLFTEDSNDVSEPEQVYETDDGDDWETEVKQTVERAFEEDHDVDIAALELNTLKMAMNITFNNLRQVVVPCLLDRIDPTRLESMNLVFYFLFRF